VRLLFRNHCDPDTVNSSGTPLCSCVSITVLCNVTHLSHLVVCGTDGSKSLIPQRNVSRDLCGYGLQEGGCEWRIQFDGSGSVVVSVHLARSRQLKGLNRNICLVQDFQSLGVRRVAEEGCAKRMEDSTVRRVVSRGYSLMSCNTHASSYQAWHFPPTSGCESKIMALIPFCSSRAPADKPAGPAPTIQTGGFHSS
jgi:hypothetical protein